MSTRFSLRFNRAIVLPGALLMAVLVFAAGCAEDKGNPDDKRADPAEDYPRILDQILEQQAYEAGETDMEDPCEGLCDRELCGYNCGNPGEQCVRACASTDTRAVERITFDVPETVTTVDTQNLTFEPRQSLWHVAVYGCRLWDFSHQDYDGLELIYGEVIHGAQRASDPQEKGVELEIYVEPFEGPGTYTGYGFFSVGSESRDEGNYYFSEDACTVDILGDESGGLLGTFECGTLANASGDSDTVSVTGEFACGSNAVELPEMVLLPYSIANGMNPDPDPDPDPMP